MFWTSELMSRETFGSDMAQDNTTQGLEYPGYTSAGKEDKLMYQSPLNRPARIFFGQRLVNRYLMSYFNLQTYALISITRFRWKLS